MFIRKTLSIAILGLSLVSLTAPSALAGSANGGTRTTTVVNAYATDSFKAMTFYAGEEAVVELKGDGSTDLDLYVYDANGNLIASDTDNTDYCSVSWTPKWTGNFTIHVKNRGRVWNRYTMVTN